jgi:hypothetical protein
MGLQEIISWRTTNTAEGPTACLERLRAGPPPLWYLEEARSAATPREAYTMDEQRPVQGQVQIKDDEKDIQGEYNNLVMIHHNLEEFTLNFIYIFPNGQQGKLLKSMIVSPGHAKRIFRALGENIARYEAQFGTIKEMPDGGPTPNVGFVQ